MMSLPRSAWRIALVLICLGVPGVTIGIIAATHPRTTKTAGLDSLDITLVKPFLEPGIAVTGPPGAQIACSYELRNPGPNDFECLSVRLTCSCQAIGEFPSRIAAGETARVRFRFRIPDTGVSQIAIPVFRGETEIATIEATLKANSVPPHLLSVPYPLDVTAIRGAAHDIKFSLYTLERDDEPAWIEGVAFERPCGLAARIDAVHDQPPFDPGVIRRTYVVRVEPAERLSTTDCVHAEARLVFHHASAEDESEPVRFPCTIRFKDPVAFLPERVVFRQRDGDELKPARARAIWRGSRKAGALAVSSVPDWVVAQFERNDPGSREGEDVLVVSVADPPPGVTVAGEIVLAVESENTVKIRLPVEYRTDAPQ